MPVFCDWREMCRKIQLKGLLRLQKKIANDGENLNSFLLNKSNHEKLISSQKQLTINPECAEITVRAPPQTERSILRMAVRVVLSSVIFPLKDNVSEGY